MIRGFLCRGAQAVLETNLARDVSSMAQQLARHGDIRLTMNRYTHASLSDRGREVQRLLLPGHGPQADGLTAEQLAGWALVGMALWSALLGQSLPGCTLGAPTFETDGKHPETAGDAQAVDPVRD